MVWTCFISKSIQGHEGHAQWRYIYYYSYAQKLLPLSSKRNLSPDIEKVMGVVCLETGSVL